MLLRGWLRIKRAASHQHKERVLWVMKEPKTLDNNEIAIKMEFDVPDALFIPPQIFAKIVVPAMTSPVTPEVVNKIEQAVKSGAGIKIKLL